MQWLGTQFSSAATYPPTQHHEGINGDTCAGKIATVSTLFGAGQPLHGLNVLVSNLGTNSEPSGTYTANYVSLISSIFALEPQIKVVMVGQDAGAITTNNTALFGSGGICDQLTALGVPIYRAVNAESPPMTHPTDFIADSFHETPAGYQKVGHLISPAVIAALNGSPPGSY